jgi:hypothetical protein
VITLVLISAAGLYFVVKAKRGGHLVLPFWMSRPSAQVTEHDPRTTSDAARGM